MTALLPEEREVLPKLIDALIGMVQQHCSSGDWIVDEALSANEYAIAVLVEIGYLERVKQDKDWYRWAGQGKTFTCETK